MIIFINGPSHSGKTTASAIIKRMVPNSMEYAVSRPLYEAAQKLLAIDPTSWKILKEYKDQSMKPIGDLSLTYFLQYLSDRMKELFGKQVLGEVAVRNILGLAAKHFIIDCGCIDEFEVIHKLLYDKNMFLFRLARPEYEWTDCRESIPGEDYANVTCIDINNQYELDMFTVQIEKAVEKWILPKLN